MVAIDPADKRKPGQYDRDERYERLNHYGQPIVMPEYYMGQHDVAMVPTGAGSPPVCTCGWTRIPLGNGKWLELHDHLAEQYPYAPERYARASRP